ncbi:MAG: glycosyltransferase family 39 protein, partial [Victivallales bacterium]
MDNTKKIQTALVCVTAAAILIRLLYAIPGIMNPELVMRTDSATYLGPALSLLHDGTYSTAAGSGVPALVRTPLYPLYLAGLLGISGHSLGFCVFVSALLGGLIAIPVFLSARLYASWKASLAAAILFALNPTAIAVAPMFISDTLFCFFLAFQIFFFLKFIRTQRLVFLFASVIIAALALLIRPLN